MPYGDVHHDALERLEAGADHEDPEDSPEGCPRAQEGAGQQVGNRQVEPRPDLVEDHLGLAAVGETDAHGQDHQCQKSEQAPRDR